MKMPNWRELRRQLFPRRYAARAYHRAFGRWPDLKNPTLFTEHMYAYKLERDPRMVDCADKVRVKQIVGEALGADWIIPTLWHGRVLPPRSERNWPVPFVLKANHGSQWNAFVRSDHDLDWDRLEEASSTWLSRRYGRRTMEAHYADIAPQLLVEPFMGDPAKAPIDYRVHVFGGKPAFFRVRVSPDQQSSYDLQWNKLPFTLRKGVAAPEVARPQSLERMVEAARVLARGFAFLRADFYEIEGRPYFSEMTFFPQAGNSKIDPPEYDAILGKLWPAG